MNWQTKVDIEAPKWRVNYLDTLFFMGSCFSVEIRERLRRLKFMVAPDAFGVLFNPQSIYDAICRLDANCPFCEADLVQSQSVWCSLMHSSDFASVEKATALQKMNEAYAYGVEGWKNATIAVITFGTSIVYRNVAIDTPCINRVVANCHKFPQTNFSKENLTIEEIVTRYSALIERHPEKRWIFTVSPIRHIRDGLHGNQLSKAVLLLAIEQLCRKFENVYYFPSYEIVMDELRDYRFYAADMCHPSKECVDHIFERFTETIMDTPTRQFASQMDSLIKSMEHRPLFPESEQYQKFVENLQKNKEIVKKKYPFVKF